MTNTFDLRDYQRDMVARIKDAWRNHRSVMVQMPTGTGKTHVLAAVVRDSLSPAPSPRERGVDSISKCDYGCNDNYDDNKEAEKKHITPLSLGEGTGVRPYGTVWLIAHRRELVTQIEETIQKMLASANAHSSFFILHSSFPKSSSLIKVFSIQWLSRHWEDVEGEPSLVVIDEAHHAVAETYRTLWDRFPKARFLGLTATPCRMNRRGFTDLFDTLICSWSIAEFIEKKYLSTFDYVSIRQGSEEQRLIDSLEKRGADGDYQIKEMNSVLNRNTSIERLYRSMEEFAACKKGIVYAISIDHARKIAEYYSSRGVNAVPIDSRTPAAERKRMVEDFKAGRIQVLVNVDIFSEGFDCPDVEFVQMARPTLSLAKYLQQVGRGLRKSKGKKTCVLIDNVGLYRVFGLPTVAWDWQAMFQGIMRGKAVNTACMNYNTDMTAIREETVTEQENSMEVIMSHEQLLADIGNMKDIRPAQTDNQELKAWQDKGCGLWGLRRDRRLVTDARFVTVFDIRYGMAAVRFKDLSCGIVDGQGNVAWRRSGYQSMKFMPNRLVRAVALDGRTCYMDMTSMRMYARRPEVRKYGNMELLKVDRTYYSRTRKVYVSNRGLDRNLVTRRRFYLLLYDGRMPVPMHERTGTGQEHACGFACLLEGDSERYYWLYKRLEDGSIIVRDDDGRYYHASEGSPKEYLGRETREGLEDDCAERMHELETRARQKAIDRKEERRETLRRALTKDGAVPFRAGMKWGLKTKERVVVPPVYRSIRPPRGMYCAVEMNYRRWGIIAVDGTVVVEPEYEDVTIGENGTARLTCPTGKTLEVKLGL